MLNEVIEPLGQTWLQLLQLSKQYPLPNLTTGVSKLKLKFVLCSRIFVGQDFMQLPHLTHKVLKSSKRMEPGGRIIDLSDATNILGKTRAEMAPIVPPIKILLLISVFSDFDARPLINLFASCNKNWSPPNVHNFPQYNPGKITCKTSNKGNVNKETKTIKLKGWVNNAKKPLNIANGSKKQIMGFQVSLLLMK